MSVASDASTPENNKGAWWQRLPRFWFVVAGFTLVVALIYGYHLATGFTPDRVAFSIPFLGLDVYWYGVIIVGGIALGAYVASFLADERGREVFHTAVDKSIAARPITSLRLTPEISKKLRQQKIENLGELILRRGYGSRSVGLNGKEVALLDKRLRQIKEFDNDWLTDAPWRQWNPDNVWNGIVWVLLFGIIGARLYHILTPSPSMAEFGIESPWDYFQQPMQMLNIRNGGLGIYGAVIGGLLGLGLYCWRQRISVLGWGDLAVVGLALGQYIGRWGNFFNQELYGSPTNLPWGLYIDNVTLEGFSSTQRFHPAFLYESLWNLLVFLVLYTLVRRFRHKLLPGDLMALYAVGYGVGRMLLETVRLDSRMLSLGGVETNLAVASFVGIVLIVTMALWRGFAHWRHRTA